MDEPILTTLECRRRAYEVAVGALQAQLNDTQGVFTRNRNGDRFEQEANHHRMRRCVEWVVSRLERRMAELAKGIEAAGGGK